MRRNRYLYVKCRGKASHRQNLSHAGQYGTAKLSPFSPLLQTPDPRALTATGWAFSVLPDVCSKLNNPHKSSS